MLIIKLTKTCNICKVTYQLSVNPEGLRKWQSGELAIQTALPELPAGARELLLSGICNTCFDSLFSDE